ncbi:hypothetical protein [Streptomyces sp. NPDC090022]|uniref:hypothetical protein n=1 Tax=Streptomyces sp. NPDC090022 TaxID=3365920 RepID=UPI0038149864
MSSGTGASMGRTLRVVIGVLVAAVAGFVLWYASYVTTIVVWELRKLFAWFALPVLAVAVTAAAWLVVAGLRRRAGRDAGTGNAAIALGCLGAAVGLGLTIGWLVYGSYLQDRAYMATARIVTEPVPGLAARSPYVVGKSQAAPHLGDVTGEIADITYLPDTDRFATLVERRGWLTGYEVGLVQDVPLGGESRSKERCAFDVSAADRRSG